MSARLKPTLSHLWRSAPLWRGAVIGAAALTLAALLSQGGGGGAGTNVGAGSYQPPPPATPTATPYQVTTPVPAAPPVDQAALAASEQRWSRFVASVQGAAKLPEAPRCEAMLAAARDLTEFDQQTKGQAKERAAAEQAALACQPMIAASDQRLARLVASGRRGSADRSAAAAQRLADALAALTDYDRARTLSEDQRDALEAARAATAALTDSDQRIAAMQSAAAAYTPEAPGTAAALLAAVGAVNNAFDQSRLTAPQRQIFADGNRLDAQLRASDSRLARLTEAMAAVRVTEDASAREGLVAALGAIDPFDRRHADPAQRIMIDEAQARAGRYALALMVEAAAGFQPERATAADYTRLAGLRRGLPELDKTRLTPAEEQAVAVGDSAVTALRASDRRIAEIARTLDAWEAATRKQALTQRVIDTYSALTPLDRGRLDHTQADRFARLEAAWRIVTKKDGGAWAGARDQVPVFVEAAGEDAEGAATVFRERLRADGFRVAGSRDEAALIVELAGQVGRLGPAPRGEGLFSGIVELSMNARWAFDGSTFLQASERGNGMNTSAENAKRDAFAKSARLLFSAFLRQVEQAAPGGAPHPSASNTATH